MKTGIVLGLMVMTAFAFVASTASAGSERELVAQGPLPCKISASSDLQYDFHIKNPPLTASGTATISHVKASVEC